MNEQLIYEIAGKKYVMVDVPFVEGSGGKAEKIIKKHGLLYQGIKKIDRGGWWSSTVVIASCLCPEENFLSFSNDDLRF